MTLEDYIDIIAEKKEAIGPLRAPDESTYHRSQLLPSTGSMGIGYGRGIYASGQLTLYFRGEPAYTRRAASRFQRQQVMEEMLRRVRNLQGEKYFLWQPDAV